MEENNQNAEKKLKKLLKENTENTRKLLKWQQELYYEQLSQMHLMDKIQKSLIANLEKKQKQNIKPSQTPNSSQVSTYQMNQQKQLPPVPTFDIRPEDIVSRTSESPSGYQDFTYYMNQEQVADYSSRKMKHNQDAQLTSSYNYSVENPRDYQSISPSGFSMSLDLGIPAEEDFSSEVSGYYMNQQIAGFDMNQLPPLPDFENIFHFQNPNYDPGSSSSGGTMRAPTDFDIASSSGGVTRVPMGFDIVSSSGVAMRTPMGGSSGVPMIPPMGGSSSGVTMTPPMGGSSYGVAMTPLMGGNSSGVAMMPPMGGSSSGVTMTPPMGDSSYGVAMTPLMGGCSSGVAMRTPRGASSSRVPMQPPMGDGFKRPADRNLESTIAEDQPGSSLGKGYDEGKKKSKSFQPLSVQQSSLPYPTHDFRKPYIYASCDSDQGGKYRDKKATMGSSSTATNHQQIMTNLWNFQD